MKRNLTWLCLREYLDARLLTDTLRVCASCCILSPFIKTKPDYCNYVLEEACRLLPDSALDVKQKTRLAREFTRVAKWLVGVISVEITPEEHYFQLLKKTYDLWLRGFWQHSEERSSTKCMYGRWVTPCRRQEPKSGRRSADYKSTTWDREFASLPSPEKSAERSRARAEEADSQMEVVCPINKKCVLKNKDQKHRL